MSNYWAMGGYGAYVWTAFGFAIVVLGGLLWQSWRFARKRIGELEALGASLTGPLPAASVPSFRAAPRTVTTRRLGAAPGRPGDTLSEV